MLGTLDKLTGVCLCACQLVVNLDRFGKFVLVGFNIFGKSELCPVIDFVSERKFALVK